VSDSTYEAGSSAVSMRPPFVQRARRALSFRLVGALYVWAVLALIFAVWVPSTFLTWATLWQLLNANAVTGLLALSLVIPLCARVFDLSVGGIASLSGVITAYMLAHHVGVVGAVALGLGAGLLVGFLNATVVVVMGVDSFIGTLATGSLIGAFITFVTNDIPIVDPALSGPFARISLAGIGKVSLPVVYLIVVAAAIWFVLEHTAVGRRFYAAGFNEDAARLAGIRVDRLRFISFLVSGSIAGVAGVVLAATVSSGDPTAGNPYLLPAFAAAFLGATQLKAGRFNAWGTIIAVLLLGTLVIGLGLAGAPTWTPQLFTGSVLIAALAITAAETRGARGVRRRLRRPAPESPPVPTAVDAGS